MTKSCEQNVIQKPVQNGSRDFKRERNLINTQMKMLELAERETERLLKRNKLNELQKHLANIEKRLGVLHERFKI